MPIWRTVAEIVTYCIARNIGVKLNLAVGKINRALLYFIPPTFDTYIKTLNTLHFNVKAHFFE